MSTNLLPHGAEGLAELGVVQRGPLLRQAPAHGLREHHERVHWTLHVRATHAAAAPARERIKD